MHQIEQTYFHHKLKHTNL